MYFIYSLSQWWWINIVLQNLRLMKQNFIQELEKQRRRQGGENEMKPKGGKDQSNGKRNKEEKGREA